MHEVTIRKVVNGYIVGVGCETFVFNSLTNLIEELGLYLTNPAERIKNWGPLLKKYHEMTSGEEDVPEELEPDQPLTSPRLQRAAVNALCAGQMAGGGSYAATRR